MAAAGDPGQVKELEVRLALSRPLPRRGATTWSTPAAAAAANTKDTSLALSVEPRRAKPVAPARA